MKSSKLLAISAIALLGFSACQQEEIAPEVTPGETHTVTFVAGAPETKTTVDISDGENAKFAWTADDEKRIAIYENGVAATTVVCGLDAGKMTIMAEFAGTATGNETYVAVVNKSNEGQIMSDAAYDEAADILVSKPVSAFDGENGVLLQFKREVAIAKMTLKGLDAGEVVNMVTVSSTADIAGSYGVDGWASPAKTSLDISSALYKGETDGYSIVANADGQAVVWFTCIPQEAATLTVKVKAADGDTYTKEFHKAITLTRGDVKGFGVAMTKDAKDLSLSFDFKTHPSGWPTSKTAASSAANYVYSLNGVDYTFSCPKEAYCGGTTETSGYLLIPYPSAMGLPAISGYKLVKVVGTLNDSGTPSTSSSISITTDGTNVVNGGAGQTWSTKGNEYTYSLVDTEEGQVYYFTVSNKNCQMIKLVLTYKPAFARPNLATPTNLAVSTEKVVSWDAVDGAASYVLTIGTEEYPCTSNSYDAKDIADEYYDVAVVAVPYDTENYKNSAAATLPDAKFGTPKLPTPTISAGVLEETSVAFSWTKDVRATNGYHWALYNGETLVQEAIETSKTSTEVTGLTFGTTYTAKVYALAVDGDKPYVQSSTESLNLTTKTKTTISTIVAAGTGETKYSIADLTVMAANGSNFVVKDNTGLMFCYKSGAKAGDVVTLAGTYEDYQGLKEFKATTYTKASTAAVDHGTATELNSSNAAAYVNNPVVQYVKANATVAANGSLKVGDVAVYQYGNSLASYAGRTINLYGYTLGYNTKNSNIVLLQTSVEIDQTVPYLSVDPTSKTWESTEKDAAVFTVTTNTEGEKDWSVSPTTLDWATIAVDKQAGTITVTPKDANTAKTANEATLTVSHSAGTLSETITLTQSAAGEAIINKFSQTFSYGLKDWSLTEYDDKSSYYLVPSGDNPSVATISGIFTNRTIQSDVVITLNVATYGNGTNPSASTFSIYADSGCQTSVTATQSGTLPTSKTYTNAVYTVTKENASALISDLAIKITKPGKQIRLNSIKIEFSYSE